MKIVIFSDAHGNKEAVDTILKNNQDAAYVISLGDTELTSTYLDTNNILAIKGNYINDPGLGYSKELHLHHKNIYITHGHKHGVHWSLNSLVLFGRANNYDLMCFGHTHKALYFMHETMHVVNPGSCSESRNHLPPSYVVVHLNKKIVITFKEVATHKQLKI
ncbi:MAG: YfcE family phosphodiesterase [Candidatus Izimaplasma sp.]|nr:YfcE family phosphodiesterase [Candidatus Izimaplasma bacterium]